MNAMITASKSSKTSILTDCLLAIVVLLAVVVVSVLIGGCVPGRAVETANENPSVERKEPLAQPAPAAEKQPWVRLPPAPEMTPKGLDLVIEQEVGGRKAYERNPHPEYENDEASGVTWGVGYDGHQNSRAIILGDWSRLGPSSVRRLADTQPFYGHAARAPWLAVRDILVPWPDALSVFVNVDLARVDQQCRRAFPGFDDIRPGCQDALRSLVFNRGPLMAGDSRREMREIRDLVQKRPVDYDAIAVQFRKMTRVWAGRSIYADMRQRRAAEAELVVSR